MKSLRVQTCVAVDSVEVLRQETYGALYEANTSVGVARALMPHEHALLPILETLQQHLFAIGLEVNGHGEFGNRGQLLWLREQLTHMKPSSVPNAFVLPGGTPAGAELERAGAILIRANRAFHQLSRTTPVGSIALLYVDTAPSFAFYAGRSLHREAGLPDLRVQGADV